MIPFPLTEADRLIPQALAEDVGYGDVTTLGAVTADATATARLVAKQEFTLAGLRGFRRVFELLDPDATCQWEVRCEDGDRVATGDTLLTVTGPARLLLTGERTALNLLQRLSGVATLTARWVSLIEGTGVKLVDTRKTTPGLRVLEKYAVRVGGGHNHRVGLSDGILIKENHIRAAGSIAKAVKAVRDFAPHTLKIEVEVTTLEELDQAAHAGAHAALLDNMDLATMRQAVARHGGDLILEASGNMTEQRLPEVAATGVDLISAGALTHSAPSVDVSLLF